MTRLRPIVAILRGRPVAYNLHFEDGRIMAAPGRKRGRLGRLGRLLGAVSALAALLALGLLPAAAASANTGFGPGGPVWVGGVLNVDSVNGQTMLHAIGAYDAAVTDMQQQALGLYGTSGALHTIAIFPSATATADGTIDYIITRGYYNAAGQITGLNVYELHTSLNVHNLSPAGGHADAVLVNSWNHWHV